LLSCKKENFTFVDISNINLYQSRLTTRACSISLPMTVYTFIRASYGTKSKMGYTLLSIE